VAANQDADNDSAGVDPQVAALVWEYDGAVKEDRFAEAEAASNELMSLVLEQAINNPHPNPYLRLDIEAAEREATADWAGAESAYREQLSRAIAEHDTIRQSMAWRSLAKLNALLGNKPEALACDHNALGVECELDTELWRAMRLASVAQLELNVGHISESLLRIDEALNLVPNEKQCELMRAMLTTTRADALLAAGNLQCAIQTLESCVEPIAKQCVMRSAAGVQSAGAYWWEVKARCASAENEAESALEAWSNAIAFRRHVAGLWETCPYAWAALARSLTGHACAARSCDEWLMADELDCESREIRQRIDLAAK
jgi:tetratricopeptide (TPR) repeat protein